MTKRRDIFLYSNQPVIRFEGRYYTVMKNFVDFLAVMTNSSEQVRLVVPCKQVDELDLDTVAQLDLPDDIIPLDYYEGHAGALTSSFTNALRFRRRLRQEKSAADDLVIAGPGPNSFLFWLSLLAPRKTRYGFFIRGDTLRTVAAIYRGRLLYYPATLAVRLFRGRIRQLLGAGRACVFLYGEKVGRQYRTDAARMLTIAPLIDRNVMASEAHKPLASSGPLHALFIGRLSQEKNLFALLDAARALNEQKVQLRVSVIGFGPQEAELAQWASDNAADEWLQVCGYVSHGAALFRYIDDCDFLCLPSLTEGVPRAVVESLARGLPVLATRVGGLPGLFPDDVRFIEGFDVAAVRAGVEWCLENREEFWRMGEQGRASVAPFVLENNAERVLERLETL